MLKSKLFFCFLTASFLFLSSCQKDDDTVIQGITDPNTNTNTGTNNNGNNTSNVLNLPATPFNYSNLNLPNYFNAQNVRNQDNTPNNNPVTDAGATLGRVLFYDTNLSFNNTISCASCHRQEDGFSDPGKFSTGFEGGLTGRNSMGLANAKYYQNGRFFWDERAASLEDQVLMPIQDHVEMGMELDDLVARLETLDYYPSLFEDAFGSSNISNNTISRALAQFIRSMVSYQSKYDAGLQSLGQGQGQGQNNNAFPNFTASENLGKQLFFSNRTNCDNCHASVNFVGPNPRNNGLDLVYADNGVGDISNNQNDNGDFKVNSLRNIELTGPYMHDGRFATLEEVVEHYNSGVQAHPNLSPQLRGGGGGPGGGGNNQPRVLNLSNAEKQGLVDFLKTLTDQQFITDEKFSNPFL